MVSSITGSPIQYAGGGGGGAWGSRTAGLGGGGGGGNGGMTTITRGSVAGYSGLPNTGGGGGGSFLAAGGAGGSGIVVIRYPSYLSQATSTTGSPTYYQAGGYNVYIFYASSTITF